MVALWDASVAASVWSIGLGKFGSGPFLFSVIGTSSLLLLKLLVEASPVVC